MQSKALKRLCSAILILLAVVVARLYGASGQHGEPNQFSAGGYEPDRQTAAFRSSLAVVDTLTTAGVLATTEFKVYGKTNIPIGARFSASGQTCQVEIAYIHKSDVTATATDTSANTIKGWSSVITLTGTSSQKEGSYYEAPDYVFDGDGAVTARVLLISAPASGTVTLWAGSY